MNNFDVRELLPRVKVPTLVMHSRDDLVVPVDVGRQMAAGIPGARFIALPGRNHLFLKHDPAAARFSEEINLFLTCDPGWRRLPTLCRNVGVGSNCDMAAIPRHFRLSPQSRHALTRLARQFRAIALNRCAIACGGGRLI